MITIIKKLNIYLFIFLIIGFFGVLFLKPDLKRLINNFFSSYLNYITTIIVNKYNNAATTMPSHIWWSHYSYNFNIFGY